MPPQAFSHFKMKMWIRTLYGIASRREVLEVRRFVLQSSHCIYNHVSFLGGSDLKEFTCNAGDRVWSLGWGVPWRRAWKPTPVSLPGESPWTEEPGGLQSTGSQRVGRDWCDLTHTTHHTYQVVSVIGLRYNSDRTFSRVPRIYVGSE